MLTEANRSNAGNPPLQQVQRAKFNEQSSTNIDTANKMIYCLIAQEPDSRTAGLEIEAGVSRRLCNFETVNAVRLGLIPGTIP